MVLLLDVYWLNEYSNSHLEHLPHSSQSCLEWSNVRNKTETLVMLQLVYLYGEVVSASPYYKCVD